LRTFHRQRGKKKTWFNFRKYFFCLLMCLTYTQISKRRDRTSNTCKVKENSIRGNLKLRKPTENLTRKAGTVEQIRFNCVNVMDVTCYFRSTVNSFVRSMRVLLCDRFKSVRDDRVSADANNKYWPKIINSITQSNVIRRFHIYVVRTRRKD